MIPRVLSASVLVAAVALSGAGCGGSGTDNKAACDNIQQEIKNTTTTSMNQISDPNAMAKTYSDGAAKIRGYGKDAGGDVESAASDVADALEGLGKAVASQTGQQPDQQPLISAGTKFKSACE